MTLRPAFHLTPPRNWMNDPNGLVHHEGEYHAFFQHNPHGLDWGNISWGHAVSPDLVRWEHLPVALEHTESEYCFSGSVVVDHDDTAGFGSGAFVALYTSHEVATGRQSQAVAFSRDRGRTWERYAANPVLDIGSTEFRDPKVFRHDGRWVMAVALATEHIVRLYSSTDLRRWEHLSDIEQVGATGTWECPDLFPVAFEDDPSRTRWVLIVSVQSGGPAGGSGTQYVIGDFDGFKFVPDPLLAPDWLDHGADNYAAVSFAGTPDDQRLVMGWMSNWAYAHATPADAGFRGAMTLPRRLALREVDDRTVVVQHPVVATRPTPTYTAQEPVRESAALPVTGSRLHVRADLVPGDAGRVGLRLRVGDGEHTEVGYDVDSGCVYVDRTASGVDGFGAGFAAVHRAPYQPRDGVVPLEVHVDTSSVEVFAGNGEVALTDLVYPSPESTGVAVVAASGAALQRLEITDLTAPGASAHR